MKKRIAAWTKQRQVRNIEVTVLLIIAMLCGYYGGANTASANQGAIDRGVQSARTFDTGERCHANDGTRKGFRSYCVDRNGHMTSYVDDNGERWTRGN